MTNTAATFRELHKNTEPLRLPNAWDAGSARLFEELGASAIATTSAGVSWSLGYPDSNVLPLKLLVQLVANIERVIRIPLSVDVEAGYAADPKEVAENVKAVLDAGAVGINMEDGTDDPELLAAKITAVRNIAARNNIEVFINVRTDVYLRGLVSPEKCVEETCRRAVTYRSAGGDGLFVPGVTAPAEISAIANEVNMPLNVLAWPGLPNSTELGKLGVRRLSAGSGIAQVLWSHAAELAKGFLDTGDSAPLSGAPMSHGKLQQLFTGRLATTAR